MASTSDAQRREASRLEYGAVPRHERHWDSLCKRMLIVTDPMLVVSSPREETALAAVAGTITAMPRLGATRVGMGWVVVPADAEGVALSGARRLTQTLDVGAFHGHWCAQGALR